MARQCETLFLAILADPAPPVDAIGNVKRIMCGKRQLSQFLVSMIRMPVYLLTLPHLQPAVGTDSCVGLHDVGPARRQRADCGSCGRSVQFVSGQVLTRILIS